MAALAEMAAPKPSAQVSWVVAIIGGSSVVAQIVLLRELLSLFEGTEISIGAMLSLWLLWTAFGSIVFGALTRRIRYQRSLVALLQVVAAGALPAAILVVRYSRVLVPAITGEVLSPVRMALTSVVALAVFCPISGLLFVSASRWSMCDRVADTATATSRAYMMESVGAAAAGLAASIFLLPYFSSLQIAFLSGIVNLMVAVWIIVPGYRCAPVAGALIIITAVLFPAVNRWELISIASQWPGFRLVDIATSQYGSLAVLDSEGSRSLAQNGVIVFTSPDPESAEEAVHFAMLQHAHPRFVLLVGGGVNGSAAQVLQYASVQRLDYVELDPMIVAFSERYFSSQWSTIRSDARLRVHSLDGRSFLRTAKENFDVVIVNVPEPRSAQLNRFFTREFFSDVAACLNPGGIVGFEMRGAENYLSPPRAAFLQSINRTLSESFAEVRVIPGDMLHFLAAPRPGSLTIDPDVLIRRMEERHLQTLYVREYFLPFRLTPERISDLAGQVAPGRDTPVNQDLAPFAYYLDMTTWSAQFDAKFTRFLSRLSRTPYSYLLIAMGTGFLICAATLASVTARLRMPAVAGLCTAAMGMTLLGLEVFLLLGFQALYGYVFNELAVVIAGFMLGIAAGTKLALSVRSVNLATNLRYSVLVQLLATIIAIATALGLLGLAHVRASEGLWVAAHIAFPLFAAACGLVGGMQFPLASSMFFETVTDRHAGLLYGLDLLGSCVGAIMVGVFLVPVFGLPRAAVFLAVANCGVAVAAVTAFAFSGPHLQRRVP